MKNGAALSLLGHWGF